MQNIYIKYLNQAYKADKKYDKIYIYTKTKLKALYK